jgi:hypothetical protein
MIENNMKINAYRLKGSHPYASSDEDGSNGAFRFPINGKLCLYVVASDGEMPQAMGWEHISVHAEYKTKSGKRKKRTPTWEEMCHIKDMFWGKDECVIQFHPPESEYVNCHPHTLHLWRNHLKGNLETPPNCFV